MEGGVFANGQTRYTVTDVWTRTAVVTWSSTPQSGDAYLRCEVELVSTDHIADIDPAIYAVPKPDQVDQADASGDIIVLTSSSSVALSTGSDSDWWVDDYKWVFDPTSGTTDTYFPSTSSKTIILDSFSESGEIRVQTYNDHCDDYSSARTATIKRKLPTPSWSTTPPNYLCNNSTANIGISSVPNATSYTYTATGGIMIFDLSDYSYKTSFTTTYCGTHIQAPSSGNLLGTVSVKANRSGILSSESVTANVWIGAPPEPTTYPSETEVLEISLYDTETFYVTYGPYADSYSWTATGCITATSPSTNPFLYVEGVSEGYGYWTCKAINTCGDSPTASGTVEVIDRALFGPFLVYPIPADSYINIVADESSMDTSKESVDTQLSNLADGGYFRIINKTGEVKITEQYRGNKEVQINVSKLDPGLYTLQLISKEAIYNLNISISR